VATKLLAAAKAMLRNANRFGLSVSVELALPTSAGGIFIATSFPGRILAAGAEEGELGPSTEP
jgi:hypothetical protein